MTLYPDQDQWRRTLAAMRSDSEIVDELLALASRPWDSSEIVALATRALDGRIKARGAVESETGGDYDSSPGVEIVPAVNSEEEE